MPEVTQHSGDPGIQSQASLVCVVSKPGCLWPHHSASGSKMLDKYLDSKHKGKAPSAPLEGCGVSWEHVCLASAFHSNKCFFVVLTLLPSLSVL